MKKSSFVTTQQAARLLNVSLRTIQLWTESGILSAWKTAGGHRRISAESVEQLRHEQIRATGADGATAAPAIVVVEDDPVYRELYTLKVATWKLAATIATAKDGFEGLLTIGRLDPDLVITDLRMPGMDGFQMIQTLRKGSPKLEIVVVTGLSDRDIQRAGGLPGDVELLRKPPDLDKLHSLIRSKIGVEAERPTPGRTA